MLPERVTKAKEALWGDPDTLLWLRQKYNWSDQTVADMNLGLEDGRVLFPSQDYDGAWFYTTRQGPAGFGAKYLHEYGRAPIVYNYRPPIGEVWLCEGHSDTVTAVDLGYRAIGLLGTSAARKAMPYLAYFRRVNVVMDADPAGYKALRLLAENLDNMAIIYFAEPPKWEDTGEPYVNYKYDLTSYRKEFGDEATKDRLERFYFESTTSAQRPRSRISGSFDGAGDVWGSTPAGRLFEAGTFQRQGPSENLSRGLGYLASRRTT